MMTVKLFAMLRSVAGAKELNVPCEDGCTVRDLIQAVSEVCPALKAKIVDKNGQLAGGVQIMLNGRSVTWLEGLDTTVGTDDDLIFMPMIGGG